MIIGAYLRMRGVLFCKFKLLFVTTKQSQSLTRFSFSEFSSNSKIAVYEVKVFPDFINL